MSGAPPARWLPVYGTLAIVWGSSYFFIATALQSFTPLGVAACRMALGAITLLVICAVTRTPLPPRSLWPRLAMTAVLATVLPWSLWAIGQSFIPSALAAIMASSIPLLTLVLMLAFFRDELPSRERMAGLVIGFAGIILVLGLWRSMPTSTWLGIGAALAGNIAFAASLPYARRYLTGGPRASSVPPLSLAAGMLAFASIETIPFAILTGFTNGPLLPSAVAGLLTLGCIGSGVAYLLNYTLIRLTDTTTASTVLYAMPIVGVGLGVMFLGDSLTWNEVLGGAVVLVGAAMAQGLLRFRRARTQEI